MAPAVLKNCCDHVTKKKKKFKCVVGTRTHFGYGRSGWTHYNQSIFLVAVVFGASRRCKWGTRKKKRMLGVPQKGNMWQLLY